MLLYIDSMLITLHGSLLVYVFGKRLFWCIYSTRMIITKKFLINIKFFSQTMK